jgi:hypothetical protein
MGENQSGFDRRRRRGDSIGHRRIQLGRLGDHRLCAGHGQGGAANAVAERLGAICVAQLNRDAAKSRKLEEMKDKDAWDKGKFIETQSWAIMPGDQKPESGVADACAKQLSTKA